MSKIEALGLLSPESYVGQLDSLLNEVKHRLDFGPIAARRRRRAEHHVQQTGILEYILPNRSYLDVGCGKGYIGAEIKTSVRDVGMFGIDLDDRPTKRMQKVISHTFSTADARKIPLLKEIFDGTMVFFVMHHIDLGTQESLLKEVMRVTKKGGYVFVAEDTVPRGDIDQWKRTMKADRRFNPDFKLKKPHTFRSKEEWLSIFERLNLTSIKVVDYQSGEVPHTFFALSK